MDNKTLTSRINLNSNSSSNSNKSNQTRCSTKIISTISKTSSSNSSKTTSSQILMLNQTLQCKLINKLKWQILKQWIINKILGNNSRFSNLCQIKTSKWLNLHLDSKYYHLHLILVIEIANFIIFYQMELQDTLLPLEQVSNKVNLGVLLEELKEVNLLYQQIIIMVSQGVSVWEKKHWSMISIKRILTSFNLKLRSIMKMTNLHLRLETHLEFKQE